MKQGTVSNLAIQNLIDRIAEEISPEQIILFGSQAKGNPNPDSDVDLLVIYCGELSKREVKLKIRRIFSKPDFSMDLFVLTHVEFELQRKVPATLGQIASKEGIVCYG